MTVPSPVPAESARRLWRHALGGQTAPEAVAVTAERTCAQLRSGLRRWIGEEGYRSLLERSLLEVRPAHPALATVSCLGAGESEMTVAVQEHGADQLEAGLLALLTALVEMLGRILGDELAARLVEQAGRGPSGGNTNTESPGDING